MTGEWTLQICRATAMAVMLLLFGNPLLGATVTWNANGEPDLAGYRVYRCSQLPCAKSASTATLLATLGKVTGFNIGKPAVVQYYVVTAYDFNNYESSASPVVTYIPAGASPPPPAATVNLTVLGSPNLGQPWAVQATTTASGSVSVQFWVNGTLAHTEITSPYCAFGDSSGICTRVQKPLGYYTLEARVLSNGTEVARQAIVINATGIPFPPATASLTVLGSPNLGQPWAVQATTNASGPVAVQFWVNGALARTEITSPYCAFNDASGTCTRVDQPAGYYTMEARVLSNGTEVARQVMVINAM